MLNLSSTLTLLLGNLPTFVAAELTRLLHTDPTVRVVGTAVGSDDLARQARRLQPGLVIVGESQLLGLEQLRHHYSGPVLLYTTQPPLPGMLREVARLGVYDYLSAAPMHDGQRLAEWGRQAKRKVQAARPRPAVATPLADVARRTAAPLPPRGVVVIGGSTGGAQAVEEVLRALPVDFSWAVLVAVHLPASFTDTLVERLRRASVLPVTAASEAVTLEAGKVLVAPGGFNCIIKSIGNSPWLGWQVGFINETSLEIPSVDLLMQSAARVVGRNVVGVVLTGLGNDGTAGARAIREQGGVVVAQDEASSAVFGMPKSVIRAGQANAVLPLASIADFVLRHVLPRSGARLGFISATQPLSR
ncbi:chemotaxis protein CheB [Hymenobacter wooponensis]|uniref:protein-glutamate methylesterase n=1 Tax=Hymenobacter wooponensis TaxID=1525360 RepID=A0A4Z0MLS8_9BACT|nr:chemotaxis protein CheB [Hymenobacter wooponensis]TGD80703.1 chemotaxis protein CheB [Hymenobacter wooponensis]